jgi:S-methylmethionine-dependent homocysteine/selenocysteine methylase
MTTAELLGEAEWVTDGGLETDLLFNKGIDLPHFAAFPLLEEAGGRSLLEQYYAQYASIA